MNNMTFGDYLKSVREEKGLSYEDVHKATKITRQVIIDLESMNTSKFPPQAYLNGLIRSYCNFLDINPHEVFDLIKKNELQLRHLDFEYLNTVPDKRRRVLFGVWISIFSVIVVGLGFAVYFFYQPVVSYISGLVEQRRIERASSEQNTSRISSLEEREFVLGEVFILESNERELRLELIATDPAILRVGDEQLTLNDNQVVFFNVDAEGEDDFAILSRGSNGESDKVILRIDPNIYQDFSLFTPSSRLAFGVDADLPPNTNERANGGASNIASLINSAEGTVVLELALDATTTLPLTVSIRSSDELYAIVEQNQTSREQVITQEQAFTVQFDKAATFYLSHTSSVEFLVNDILLSLGDSALPQAFILALSPIDSTVGGSSSLPSEAQDQQARPDVSGYVLKKVDIR